MGAAKGERGMEKARRHEEKVRRRAEDISRFYLRAGRMPSFSEIGELAGLRSKNSVSKLVGRLEGQGVLRRDEKRRLIPGPAIGG